MPVVGTVSVSETRNLNLSKVDWTWTSDASGNVSGKLTVSKHTGIIERLVTDPYDQNNAPTEAYNVQVLDEDGFDVLMGAGAARETEIAEQVAAANLGICVNSTLELKIDSAGNAKKGKVHLYLYNGHGS